MKCGEVSKHAIPPQLASCCPNQSQLDRNSVERTSRASGGERYTLGRNLSTNGKATNGKASRYICKRRLISIASPSWSCLFILITSFIMAVLLPLFVFAMALLGYAFLFVGRRGRNLPPGPSSKRELH